MIVSTLRKAGAVAGKVIDQDDRELLGRLAVLCGLVFGALVFVGVSIGAAVQAFELVSRL